MRKRRNNPQKGALYILRPKHHNREGKSVLNGCKFDGRQRLRVPEGSPNSMKMLGMSSNF